MAELDISRAPRGVLASQQLVAVVAEIGDLAERHYLELKSTLDLSTKKDKEKIAKFILGAANRMPDIASTAFEGYGVMLIGVAKGAIVGIPPVEMMDISKVIQQYVGAAGPRWDIVWVPVEESTNQVLVILVDPPKVGQGPFACRASGESLTDGRIYIRVEGETREAKSEEVDLLVQRGTAGPPTVVDFGVEVFGEVAPVEIDRDKTVEEYISLIRQTLERALPNESSNSSSAGISAVPSIRTHGIQAFLDSAQVMASSLNESEKRTREEYLHSIDAWEERFRQAWDEAVPKITGSQLRPAIVRVTNRTAAFFRDVAVKLHLEGDIVALDYGDPEYTQDSIDRELPRPPREWGPTQKSFLTVPTYANMANLYQPLSRSYIPPSIRYKNGGSVSLDLSVGELRPRGTYESEEDELIFVVRDRSMTAVRATWELTARDHNEVFAGEVEIPVQPVHDITAAARQILDLDVVAQ